MSDRKYAGAVDAAEIMDGVEHRYQPANELRVHDDEPTKLVGHAAVFDKLSEDLGWFREIIRPGAFTETLKRGDDVRALLEHEGGLNTLGRTTNGTLQLREDAVGLFAEITPPDTSVGRDTMELVKRGDLTQMSFGFRVIDDIWRTEDEVEIREVLKADLFDVSIVSFPAYKQTDIVARSRFDATRLITSKGKPSADRRKEIQAEVDALLTKWYTDQILGR